MIDPNLNMALLDAVDTGLLILGENSRKAIYFHLERTFKIKREEIGLRFKEFQEALQDVFGPGAEVINALIAKELQSTLTSEEKEHFEIAVNFGSIQEINQTKRPKRGKSGASYIAKR